MNENQSQIMEALDAMAREFPGEYVSINAEYSIFGGKPFCDFTASAVINSVCHQGRSATLADAVATAIRNHRQYDPVEKAKKLLESQGFTINKTDNNDSK